MASSRTVTGLGVALALLTAGCGSALTLTVEPSEAPPPELLPAPQLSENAYRNVLVLPPEAGVEVKDVEVPAASEKKAGYYVAKLEKVMLSKGFEVISSEVTARADKDGSKVGLSAAEKAMMLGRKTQADAVLIVQSIAVRGGARYFEVGESQTLEVDAARVKRDDDGAYYNPDTEQCVHRLPYYQVSLEAKLVDARTGSVLWVGSGRAGSVDVIKDSWVAEVDDDCNVLDQNFVYRDYQADENTFDNTVATLFGNLIEPLSKVAFKGAPIVRDAPKKAAPPPPPKPPEPKIVTAVVSAKTASLRDGPGNKHPRKMRVPRKAKVEVVETMGEWLKVKIQDGTVGWMHESVLIVNE